MHRHILSLISVAALAALPVAAGAADLAMKYPVKAVPTKVFSWTGFYIGGNVGYGGGEPTATGVTSNGGVFTSYDQASLTSSGFFAGGQVGYNYQFANNVVLGVETDLQWSGIKGELATLDSSGTVGNFTAGPSLTYFGTVRARLGYAIDRFLPYVTGGAAYGRSVFEATVTNPAGIVNASSAATTWGWTVGAGGEFAVTNNWTVKAEYLYVDLGNYNYAVLDTVNGTIGAGSVDSKIQTFKAGVNYKF
ncbi:outer membrane protein [Xanthobacter aminoxidans]|uniref:outer membrane protein n=1 Tax=Xanthobacter aminoxidans TaxID=186280 RepID=UPI002022EC3A|nr:outer membrane protein [Xanthobacter aminoxidans]MCL8383989.1 porin family protein [Xanthobacter aminoxidans]